MQEVKKIITILFLLVFARFSFGQVALAQDVKASFDLFSIMDSILSQDIPQEEKRAGVLIDDFQQVINKTNQGNPLAAREDLKKISSTLKNNYQRLNFAKFLYSNGYFSYADEVLAVITNDDFKEPIKMLREAYGVKYALRTDEENALNKYMALIHQENMAQEASFGLNKKRELIKKSDWANYVMACAFFELGQYDKSLQYANRAEKINEDNLTYKLFKAKILNAQGEYKKAQEVVKRAGFGNVILRDEFLKTYYTASAKLAKNGADKLYYDGLVHYLNHDFYGAIEVVHAALYANDKDLRLNHLLFKALINTKDIEVAQKIADKMVTYNKKSPYTQDALGDLNFINANYLFAGENYEKALKLGTKDVYLKFILTNKILNKETSKKIESGLKGAKTGDLDENYQLAIGILSNANVKNIAGGAQDEYKNAYNSLKLYYLREALIKNPCNSFYLLELVDSARGAQARNLNLLELVTYLGDFNFYYYWKLGEFEEFNGNKNKAFEYYKKALNLNPRFEPVSHIISNENF